MNPNKTSVNFLNMTYQKTFNQEKHHNQNNLFLRENQPANIPKQKENNFKRSPPIRE